MKPSQVARFRPQHLIVFGEPKVGKSTLAAELLLHGYNLTWVSMDNGHDVIFKLPIPAEVLDEKLNIIIIPDTKEMPVAIATCLKIISGAEVNICDKHGQVDCVSCKRVDTSSWSKVHCNAMGPKDIIVFDHLGQISSSAMARIFIKGKKSDDDKAEWDDYYAQGSLLDRFLTNVQQAPYNIICITHVSETVLEDGTKKLVPLAGTTNFSRNSGKYFDHMIYCEVMNRSHKFGSSTTYGLKVVTGSRSDVEIEKEKIPSLLKFFDGTIKPLELQGSLAAEKVLTRPVISQEKVEEALGIEVVSGQTVPVPVPVPVDNPVITWASKGKIETMADDLAKAEASFTKPEPISTAPPEPTSAPSPKDRLAMLTALKSARR